MELDLKMQEIGCYETAQRMTVSHEETMETAIPEYCPDLARIVDAVGQLKIREKKLSGARLTIGGTVRVTVLYTSEESAGLRSLVLTVPFSCAVDDERLRNCRSICGSGRLQLVEARSVSARKLHVRVMAEFEVEGIGAPACSICSEVPEDPTLQIRREERQVRLLTCLLEREFNFRQECRPGPEDGVPEDLLLDRLALRVMECQRLSNKLIVKGDISASLLYRTDEQKLDNCELLLPFSQIIDAAELPENAEYQAEVWIQDSDVRIVRTDSGVGFSLSLRVGLVVKTYEQRTLHYIADLYSTAAETQIQRKNYELSAPRPIQVVRQEAAQTLEFGRQQPFAHITALECGGVTMTPEREGTALRVNLHLQILYLDETGAPISTERTIELTFRTELHPEAARAICAPVVLQSGANRCEVRIPVDFLLDQADHIHLDSVTGASLLPLSQEAQPSIVLRRTEEGEKLWDIAKAYRTAPSLIESANSLEPGAPLTKGILLIPKVRT